MPKLYRPREVVRVLETLGWHLVRQRGSHARLALPGGKRPVTVPMSAREVDRKTLRDILRQADLLRESFGSRAEEVL